MNKKKKNNFYSFFRIFGVGLYLKHKKRKKRWISLQTSCIFHPQIHHTLRYLCPFPSPMRRFVQGNSPSEFGQGKSILTKNVKPTPKHDL